MIKVITGKTVLYSIYYSILKGVETFVWNGAIVVDELIPTSNSKREETTPNAATETCKFTKGQFCQSKRILRREKQRNKLVVKHKDSNLVVLLCCRNKVIN